MSWTPPEENGLTTLMWLVVLGAVAMLVNLLRALSQPYQPSLKWWQKLTYSVLVGIMTVGLGSMMVAIWPDISYWKLLGVASVAGYLGTGFVLDAITRLVRGVTK